MQLIDIRNEVLAKGFDPSLFGSSRVTQFINDGYLLVCRRAQYFGSEATYLFQTASGTASYAWPADLMRERSLLNVDLQTELTAVGLREIDRSVVSQGAPYFYATDAANVHLYPTPDNPYNMQLRYWRLPAVLVSDTDVPVIPADWHRILVYWAAKECYAAEDDASTSQYWEQQFNTTLAEFIAEERFPNSDMPHQVNGMWDSDKGLRSSRGWSIYGTTWGY